MVGTWEVKPSTSGMPQAVATAVAKINEDIVGAEYEAIAYLGSQLVNGTNHAVLASQTLIVGKDVKNVVLLIFHENNSGIVLANIERIIESGAELGGTKVDPTVEIPVEAQKAFDRVIAGLVGTSVEPFAYLGNQMAKGIEYIFAAKVTPIVPEAQPRLAIVTVNPMENKISFVDMLENRQNAPSLGYAFSW